MTSTTLPPDVADLLRAIYDHLGRDDTQRCAAEVRGVLSAIFDGQAGLTAGAWAFDKLIAYRRDRRITLCDSCQLRQATRTEGCVDLCALCAEKLEADEVLQVEVDGAEVAGWCL